MAAEPRRPAFSDDDARTIARDLYGVDARVRALRGYDDLNFHIEIGSGEKRVLKIANSAESREVLDFQNRAMERLATCDLSPMSPRLCTTLAGEEIAAVEDRSGTVHCVRMLTFIEGVLLAETASHDRALLKSVGRFMGRVDRALEGFTHPAMNRDLLWDLKNTPQVSHGLDAIDSLPRRSLVELVLRRFDTLAAPRLGALRTGVIHNDANDYNLLVGPDESGGTVVCGIIDFGDMVHTCIVGVPTMAAAYAALGKDDPLAAIANVVSGFHETFPLEPAEVEVLLPLIGARLCTSVCESARQSKAEPDNAYLRISEEPAWDLLHTLAGIDSRRAGEIIFDAIGMSPPSSSTGRRIVSAGRATRSADEIITLRERLLGPSLSVSYDKPLKIVRASMQYLYDQEGRAYLDAVNNVPHVGHCHPRVVDAARKQNALLNTNTRYLHDHIVNYAQALTATMPDPLRVCFFVNSGSEANDLALRLARAHTGHEDIVVVDGAYHGNLSSLIEISPYKFDGAGGEGAPAHVHKTPMPDGYRGLFGSSDVEAGKKYADRVRDAIVDAHGANRTVAAFICESLLGCGGQIVPPPGYLKEAFDHVRAAGGVAIADEVQVGFGRVGSHFWAFETQDALPDIVTLGKPIGSGHPMACVVTTPEIAASIDRGMEYFNTYGGNPVSCAVGLAVLDVIEEENLQQNARDVGAHLIAGLGALRETHSLIGDVRGLGLFVGIELVRDRQSLEPADREASFIVERMKNEGILVSTDGPLHNVIKIKPPLVFTRPNADSLIQTLDRILDEREW